MAGPPRGAVPAAVAAVVVAAVLRWWGRAVDAENLELHAVDVEVHMALELRRRGPEG